MCKILLQSFQAKYVDTFVAEFKVQRYIFCRKNAENMKNHSQLIIRVSFAIKHDVKKVLQYSENINSDSLF